MEIKKQKTEKGANEDWSFRFFLIFEKRRIFEIIETEKLEFFLKQEKKEKINWNDKKNDKKKNRR